MEGLIIRSYLENDTEMVVTFFREASSLDHTISAVSLTDWKYFTSRSFNNNAKDFVVVEVEGNIIGLLTSMLKVDEALGAIRHFRIIVHPEYRRRKIATDLLRTMQSQDLGPVIHQCNVLGGWIAGATFLSNKNYSCVHSELLMSLSDPTRQEYNLPEGISLRSYLPEDNNWWAELSNAAYNGTKNAILQSAESVANESSAPGFQLWVLLKGDQKIGFSHSIVEETNGLLNSIVIDQDYRGKGLAKILMAASINTLIDQGSKKIELNVDSDNVAAIALYRSFGFTEYDSMNLFRRYE